MRFRANHFRTRVALVVLAASFFATTSSAQSPNSEEKSLEFKTDLPWSSLALRGSSQVRGVSPLRVPGPLSGDFWLTAKGRGVETQRGRVSIRLDEEGSRIVSYGALPFRQKFFRGLLFPGYAQWRAGDRGRGALLATGAIAALLATAREQDEVWNREEVRESAERTFLTTTNPALRPFALANLREAQEEENVARAQRNLYLISAGAVWGVGLLDAVLFAPDFNATSADESTLSLSMEKRSRGSALLRSVVFPGLGQEYSGSPRKGALVAIGAALAGALLLHESADLKQAESEVTQSFARIAVLPAGPDRDAARALLGRFEDEVDTASRDRNLALLLLAGYWGVSLLDTALSFDEPWGSTPVGEGWSFGMSSSTERTLVVASHRL